MKFLSLFSGIEAASVAWEKLGWECVGFSEIEPFACSLLQYYYPQVTNYGNICNITEQQIKDIGHIDIIIFGSPCQDLSVAGTRKGLQNGTRSGLFYEAIRIVQYARKHCGLRFALWENVPGAFSSNKGGDFAVVIREMVDFESINVPKHGWKNSGVAVGESAMLEWGVLDAKYFGVPQRRRRIFALADFGHWYNRLPILLEQESLRGNIEACRSEKKDIAKCLTVRSAGGKNLDYETADFIIAGNVIGRKPQNGGNFVGYSATKICYTLTTMDRHAVVAKSCVRRLTPMECERLQGFPDNWTNIKHKNKPASDSARYKALGNSMAVPVIEWIGKSIIKALDYEKIKA